MLKIVSSPLFLGLLALLAGEIILFRRWRSFSTLEKRAGLLVGAATVILLVASQPVVANALRYSLTSRSQEPTAAQLSQAKAVAVLGGNEERVPCGALAFKRSGATWLVLPADSEAKKWRTRALELGVAPASIVFPSYGATTYAEAQALRQVSQVTAQDRIGIATDAWHMPRALGEFRRYFPNAFAIPCGNRRFGGVGPTSFLPSASAITVTTVMVDEYLGIAWYRVRRLTGG